MNILIKIIIAISLKILFTPFYAQAGGISVDAGLTPGQDRWILRTQYRFMKMQNSNMIAQNHIFPLVVAYGITSNFTLMARGMYVKRTIEMDHGIQERGFNDPFVLLKIKVYRKNTEHYVLGLAPYFASNIPVGSKEISDRTWNPEVGLSMSLRPRFWAIDFTASYTINDAFNKKQVQESDNMSINLAFSSIIPFKSSNLAISPVLELNFNKELNSNINDSQKQEILYISPGLTFIKSSIMLEALYQIAVLQRTGEQIMKSKSRIVAGLRFMF